jgi:hypothetical protein
MQATREQEKDGREKRNQRNQIEHQRIPHKRNVAVYFEKFHA